VTVDPVEPESQDPDPYSTREFEEALGGFTDRFPDLVGRYEVTSRLAAGGFGEVFHAHDPALGRDVAIKTPHPYLIDTREDLERYLTEARTVAKIKHSNIVPIYDYGSTDDGRCYLVSELIAGRSLAEVLRAQRSGERELDPVGAAEVVGAVAEALAHVHRLGLVHRDVKPGNILLDENGVAFLTDFGIALTEENLAGPHVTAGTVAYMSPEQAAADGVVDRRSDIYCLGVVLHEMLSGEPPVEAATSIQTLAAIRERTLPPLGEEIPAELRRICARMVARNPDDRYEDAAAAAGDLRRFVASVKRRHAHGLLAERTRLWHEAPEPKQLPTLREWVRILLGTRRASWTTEEARMMRTATRRRLGYGAVLLLAIVVGSFGPWQYFGARRSRALRGELLSAIPADVARILRDAASYERWFVPAVREALGDGVLSARADLNARLALVASEGIQPHLDALATHMITADPETLDAVCAILRPHRQAFLAPLLARARDRRERSAAERLRAFVALLLLSQGTGDAADDAERLSDPDASTTARLLVRESAELAGAWAKRLTGERQRLLPDLDDAFRNGDEVERIGAAASIAALRHPSEEDPIFVDIAQPAQLAELFAGGRVLRYPEKAAAVRLARPVAELEGDPAAARARANRVLQLLFQKGCHDAAAWSPLWGEESFFGVCRTLIIADCAIAGLPFADLVGALSKAQERKAPVLRVILLALGGYEFQEIDDEIVSDVLGLYEQHPDPGVHSAAEWLLRTWGREKQLEEALDRLATARFDGARGWFVTPTTKMTMVVVDINEPAMRTERRVAFSTRELTWREWSKVLGEAPPPGVDPSLPVDRLTVPRVFSFCSELSRLDGFDADDLPYGDPKDAKPRARYLSRRGYRIATEFEWKAACEATGSQTLAVMAPTVFGGYSWYRENSGGELQAVATRMPDPEGFFDRMGNVSECVHQVDGLPDDPVSETPDKRPIQQQDWFYKGGSIHASSGRRFCGRTDVATGTGFPVMGVRLVRTVDR